MDVTQFFVPGNPKALKRHRDVRTKSGVRIRYDPSAGDKRDFLAKAMEFKPDIPYREPLSLSLVCVFPRPKSHYRTGNNSGELRPDVPVWCATGSDLDNIVKFVGDAFNGIFWYDDKLLVNIQAAKVFGDVPGIAVRIWKQIDSETTGVHSLLADIRRNPIQQLF